MISSGYGADPKKLDSVAERVDGPTVSDWHALASEYGGYVAGGICEADGDDLFNSAVVVGPTGIELHYRKLHLFSEEKYAFREGNLGLPVADLSFGKVGLCICYDLRFVETVRALALQDAELILVPTAWLVGFDGVKWLDNGLAPQAQGAILQANLSQVFIACASQAEDRGDLEFLGSSCLAGPNGDLRAGPLPGTEDALEVIEIDLEDCGRAQRRSDLITPRADRRTDVYGIRLGDEVL
jgi:predicted amidohydrolase